RDVLDGNDRRQWLECDRLEVGDRAAHLALSVLQQPIPFLEVVAGAFHKMRHAPLDLRRVHRYRAHVAVAVQDAVVDAVRGRDEQVARVVLAEAFARELDRDRLERTEHVGPMLTVAEPKLPLIPFAHAWLKGEEVRIELLPAFRSGRRLDVIWAWEPGFFQINPHSFFLSDFFVWRASYRRR